MSSRNAHERHALAAEGPAARTAEGATGPSCLRCGFPVVKRAWGCKNPCANRGFIYPLGDCFD